MLPYKEGAQMIIDPTIRPHQLHFGPVSLDLYEQIGRIKEVKYIHNIGTNAYGLKFEGKKELVWLKESEIT